MTTTDGMPFVNVSSLAELCVKDKKYRHLMQEWHPNKNKMLSPYGVTLTPNNVTPMDRRVVWWKCRNGHNWNQSVAERVEHILHGQKDGCIFCSKERIARKRTLYEYCMEASPDGEKEMRILLSEWDADKNFPLTPNDVRAVAYQKVWWKCRQGHSWQQLISNRVKAGVGCPYCGHRRVLAGYNDLETRYPELALEWDYERNEKNPSEVMPMSNQRVWWKCRNGHHYQKIISNRTGQGQGCPICKKEKRNRKGPV